MLWGELKSQCFDVIGFLANFQAASWKSIWREVWGGKLYILDTQHNIIYIGLFLINKLLPEIPSWHPKVQRSSNRKEVLSKDWRGVSGTRWREDNTAQEHDKILMVLNNIERSRRLQEQNVMKIHLITVIAAHKDFSCLIELGLDLFWIFVFLPEQGRSNTYCGNDF